jgi:hypothetical protein
VELGGSLSKHSPEKLRPYLKSKLGVGVHICGFSYSGAIARRITV